MSVVDCCGRLRRFRQAFCCIRDLAVPIVRVVRQADPPRAQDSARVDEHDVRAVANGAARFAQRRAVRGRAIRGRHRDRDHAVAVMQQPVIGRELGEAGSECGAE